MAEAVTVVALEAAVGATLAALAVEDSTVAAFTAAADFTEGSAAAISPVARTFTGRL